MCLTCGCMQAHKEMTEADSTYEAVKRAADQNGAPVAEALATISRTAAKDLPSTPLNTRPAAPRPSLKFAPTP